MWSDHFGWELLLLLLLLWTTPVVVKRSCTRTNETWQREWAWFGRVVEHWPSIIGLSTIRSTSSLDTRSIQHSKVHNRCRCLFQTYTTYYPYLPLSAYLLCHHHRLLGWLILRWCGWCWWWWCMFHIIGLFLGWFGLHWRWSAFLRTWRRWWGWRCAMQLKRFWTLGLSKSNVNHGGLWFGVHDRNKASRQKIYSDRSWVIVSREAWT